MKRIVMAAIGVCAAVAVGTGSAPAASPAVDLAINALNGVGNDTEKLKMFCEINKLLQAEKEDAAAEKQIEATVEKMGDDFAAAWEVGEKLDESSEDGKEFYAAVDTVAEKCQ